MRLQLLFDLEKPLLPRDFRMLFIAYLKNALTQYGKGQCFELYFGSARMKDYSFSVVLPKPAFKGEVIELKNKNTEMLFTANDRHKTGLIFFSAFIQQKNKRFPLPDGNAMRLKKINLLREQLIMSPKVIFKTTRGSGLVIRKHDRETNKDRYFTFQDEGFDAQAKEVLSVQARAAGFSEETAGCIHLRPIQCKKVVVKQFGLYIDVTVGVFEMEATPELLQYFYQAGLGSRKSQGTGMVDLVAQG